MSKAISTVWYDSQKSSSSHNREQIRVLQQKLTSEIQGNVYCQIHNKDISPSRCMMSQFQKECLGCSAPTHLCHSCRVRKIAFPAVELCSHCLKISLALEKKAGRLELPRDLEIPCLLINRSIKVKTCRSMQIEKCRGCEQPSRFCFECIERPIRYPMEGLCLTCLVKNFGEGWKSSQDEDGTLNSESVKVPPRVTRRNEPLTKITESGQNMVTSMVPESETGHEHTLTPELLARAISAVVQYQVCKPHTLARQLNVDEETALELHRTLISFGLIKEVPRIIDHAVSVSTHFELDGCNKIPAEVREILGLSPLVTETPVCVMSTQNSSAGLSTTEANDERRLQVLSKDRDNFPAPKKLLARVIIQIIQHQRCGFNFFYEKFKVPPSKAKKIRNYLMACGVLRWSRNKARSFLVVSFKSCHDLLNSFVPLAPDLTKEISRQVGFKQPAAIDASQQNPVLDKNSIESLTPREKEVVLLLVKNFQKSKILSDREIGKMLGIAPDTVGMHLKSIYRKFSVHTRAQLICIALGIYSDKTPTHTDIINPKKQLLKMELREIKIPPHIGRMNSQQKSDVLVAFAEVFEKLFGEKTFGAFLRSIAADMLKFDNLKTALKEVVNDTT